MSKFKTKRLCHDADGDGRCDQCGHRFVARSQCVAAWIERGELPAGLSEEAARTVFAGQATATRGVPGAGLGVGGLGDLAGEFFATLGVTEERYKAAKLALHLDPNCGCSGRRAWLNAMGEKLGVNGAAGRVAGWLKRRKKTPKLGA